MAEFEKYVYVMTEDRWNNWRRPRRYESLTDYTATKVIGVFDTYELAKKRLDKWIENMSKRDNFKYVSENTCESIVTLDAIKFYGDNLPFEEFPFGYEYEVCVRRKLHVEVLETDES